MISVYFLGTAAGTEPQPEHRHTSLVVEYENQLYWLDAGESCGHTAHLLGLDLLATAAIFISHPHMDHIGGLPHLVWTIKKLESLSDHSLEHQIQVLVPEEGVWSGLEQMMFLKRSSLQKGVAFNAQRITAGVIFDDGTLVVTAIPNQHIREVDQHGNAFSFSFLLEIGGRRILYSGDFRDLRELDFYLDDLDLLLLETGHHQVQDLCQYLVDQQKSVRQVGFYHHGRAVLANPALELEKAQAILGERVFLAKDGMVKKVPCTL